MTSFSRRLKQRREEKGISIRKISKDLEIPKSTYEGWELDSHPRRSNQYKLLADYLEVSVEYLICGNERRKEAEEILFVLEKFIIQTIENQFKQNC